MTPLPASVDTDFVPAPGSGQGNGQPVPVSEEIRVGGVTVRKLTGEFWTSRQRQASSLHEISYRACFKPQLPRFFINLLTRKGDIVYDPFSGRGTTVIEAALLGREIIANDVNPLSRIMTEPRFSPPSIPAVEKRLASVPAGRDGADIDLSMFYHRDTESELVSLRTYLQNRKKSCRDDMIDRWIEMVATNRLTGHSKGFFSVYTLPPNPGRVTEEPAAYQRKTQAGT